MRGFWKGLRKRRTLDRDLEDELRFQALRPGRLGARRGNASRFRLDACAAVDAGGRFAG
jgi:hypothetical protein